MPYPTTSFAGVLDVYDVLIHWGRLDYRPDRGALRETAYENLLAALRDLEPQAVDTDSASRMKTALALADAAHAMYQFGGNIGGSVIALTQSRDAFLGVRLQSSAEPRDGRSDVDESG